MSIPNWEFFYFLYPAAHDGQNKADKDLIFGRKAMATLFLRSVLLYLLLILTMRALGKRQLGELAPYELALTILLAEIIGGPIDDVSKPLLHGLLPVAAVMTVHGALTLLCMKSDKMRALISGKPSLVISRGEIKRGELDRLCLNLSDLLEGLRCAGYLDPTQVATAIVEANGSISAFPDGADRPLTPGDMDILAEDEGLPMILIMDGKIQKNNLSQSGKNQKWLDAQLMRRSLSVQDVYLAGIDSRGSMFMQLMSGERMRFQAMNPSEVKW